MKTKPISRIHPLDQPAGTLASKLEIPPLYYDKKSHCFWGLEKGGTWTSFGEPAAADILMAAGISNEHKSVAPSDIKSLITQTIQEYGVDYAGALSGFRRGFYKIGEKKLLVTTSYNLIKPRTGNWKIAAAFLKGLLGPPQAVVFLHWLIRSYLALAHKETRRPAQAVILAGPRDSGKSFLQNYIITPVLGGRACRCYRYLSGHTDFNGDLFEAEHLIVDDDVPSAKYLDRVAFGQQIKGIVASELHSCHFKYRDAFSVKPFWRLTISVNDNGEALQVLPPIDESLEDKIFIFKTQNFKMPMPTGTQEERDAFRNTILAELPAMLFRLLDTDIHPSWVSQRFGLAHYHHPEIVAAIHESSAEDRLLGIIDSALFKTPIEFVFEEPVSFPEWIGTAAELEQKLVNSPMKREVEKILSWNNSCGTYLGRLAKRYPERVQNRRTAGVRMWKILPPALQSDTR